MKGVRVKVLGGRQDQAAQKSHLGPREGRGWQGPSPPSVG